MFVVKNITAYEYTQKAATLRILNKRMDSCDNQSVQLYCEYLLICSPSSVGCNYNSTHKAGIV